MEEAVRWNVKVSKETDLTLRTFLGSRGMKKGDLSKFIEQAVRAHVFHGAVQDIKARNAETHPDEMQALIDQWKQGAKAQMHQYLASIGQGDSQTLAQMDAEIAKRFWRK